MTPIEKTLRDNLLQIVDAYRHATGKPLSAISRAFYGKAKFLEGFSNGSGSISIDKYGEMIEQFRNRWPEGAPFPYLRSLTIEMVTKKRGQRSQGTNRNTSNHISARNHEAEPTRGRRGRGGSSTGAAAGPRDSRVAGKARPDHRDAAERNRGLDAPRDPARRRAVSRRSPHQALNA